MSFKSAKLKIEGAMSSELQGPRHIKSTQKDQSDSGPKSKAEHTVCY